MKVAFVYIGILANSSRIQKQISFLLSKGYEVDVYVGNENNLKQDYSKVKFSVYEYPIVHGGFHKIKSLLNVLRFNLKVSNLILHSGYDAIVCQELSTFLSGHLVKSRNSRIKLIYDNNELSVERYSGIKKMVWSVIQKLIISSADIVIHPEINRLNYFIKKHNLPLEKNRLVCNYPYKKLHKKDNLLKQNKLIYIGVIHPNRMLEELINALSNTPVQFDIVGPGDPTYVKKLIDLVADKRNINVLPPVKEDEIDALLSGYTIGLAFYSNSNLNNYYCAPNKVYQYVMNRVNVITNNYPGLKMVVEDNHIGVCLDEITSEGIRSAVDTIIERKLSLNFNDDIIARYSWESQEPELEKIFME